MLKEVVSKEKVNKAALALRLKLRVACTRSTAKPF